MDIKDIFPTLDDYYNNHCEHNLKKVCLEMQEFYTAIYSTLQTEEEKQVFLEAINRLTTF